MADYVFEWYGDHPAANFVNTLDERLSEQPVERLTNYAALVDFVRQAGLIDRETADRLMQYAYATIGGVVWVAMYDFREALYRMLRAAVEHQSSDADDLAIIEEILNGAHAARTLQISESGFTWAWKDGSLPLRPLWELALAAENLLLTEPNSRIRKCAADDCGVLFVDHSRAGARRWCSMAECGNRYKVQAFRAGRKHNHENEG